MRKDVPDGFFIPFHQSTIVPVLAAGIDRNLCLALWSVGISIGIMMQVYVFLVVIFMLHMLLREFTKKDDMFFKVLVSHIHNKKFYC